jgi:hypothetical protein
MTTNRWADLWKTGVTLAKTIFSDDTPLAPKRLLATISSSTGRDTTFHCGLALVLLVEDWVRFRCLPMKKKIDEMLGSNPGCACSPPTHSCSR